MTTFYVDPVHGSDRNTGDRTHPLRTLTYSLRQTQPDDIVTLLPGLYSQASGESFPIAIPAGVIVVGQERNHGENIEIQGGNLYDSPTFRQQNITILFSDRPSPPAQLRGITVSNPNPKGIGIWIESSAPIITNTTITRCRLAGVAVTGTSKPKIQDNYILNNGSAGIFLRRNAKGELTRNRCHATGYGITLSDDSAPLVTDNTCTKNQVGVYLSHRVQPVLRRNRIEDNTTVGLMVKEVARPDLGHPQDPARNIFRNNGRADVQNDTDQALVLSGNQVERDRIQGPADLPPIQVQQGSLGPSLFRDIADHWAAPFIEALIRKDLLRGFPDGTFRPDGALTRAEYAALIAKSFDLPRQLGTRRSFRDVEERFWGAEAIAKAAQMGFIAGYEDGTFRPQQNLTRVQAIVSLVNGLGLAGANLDSLMAYRDRALIPSYATAAVAIATEKRLIATHPDPRELHPMREINRAEIAAFLYQSLVTIGQAPPLFSSYLVDPDPYLPTFIDISGHWAEPFLRRLTSLELISGFSDGSFRPDAPINRAQYAALLVKLFNPPPIRPVTQFLDVPDDFWGHAAIQQAYRAGFLTGFPDGTFHPDQRLHRIHVIVSLASGLRLPPAAEGECDRYPDAADIPAYARAAVASATAAQLIIRDPNHQQLAPKQDATRAETAVMLYQGLVHQGTMATIPSARIIA
ncbi:S-layer homology domain-containing protein [Spirulina major CS-329]|uniref:S-layer homology domain-containing protein n=1 Tax=Spirulina major TaxID=270636 RepID=UPI00232C6D16|nr:S-layer homology domain-containing protein [Spirulina major]MDB9503430.1 S-layer homology domain-containing protein [Spirulina major CS-329]